MEWEKRGTIGRRGCRRICVAAAAGDLDREHATAAGDLDREHTAAAGDLDEESRGHVEWTREEMRLEDRRDFSFAGRVQKKGQGRWKGAVLFMVAVGWLSNGVNSNLWWELLCNLIQWL
jgi:hypothetical protein